MFSIASLFGIFIGVSLYIFMLLFSVPWLRKAFKRILFSMLFICLLFPYTDYIEFGEFKLNVYTAAALAAGIELVDMWTKHILSVKDKKKKLNKREKIIYESLS